MSNVYNFGGMIAVRLRPKETAKGKIDILKKVFVKDTKEPKMRGERIKNVTFRTCA